MAIIYRGCISIYYYLVKLASLFSGRAKHLIASRKLSPLLNNQNENLTNLWIHCASHGEYETAKPLIKRYQSYYNIHLTFYSPSGYNVAEKEPQYWTTVRYLAFDHSSILESQIDNIDPAFVIFIQYEYWYRLLTLLNKKSVPIVYYGVQFEKDHILTKQYARFLTTEVNRSKLILTRDRISQSIAKELFDTHVVEVGDIRWLQANTTVDETYQFPFDTSKFSQIVVLGSAWKEDVTLWKSYIADNPATLFVIAPHDVSNSSVDLLSSILASPSDRWLDSHGTTLTQLKSNTLLVNILGELKYLYRIADIVYIGGGFGDGLHNCLEAAIYNVPVLISGGGNSNPEALSLIDGGIGHPIDRTDNLDQIITKVVSSHDKTKAASYLAGQLEKSRNAYTLLDHQLNV